MKLSLLSCALLWASSLSAAPAFNDAVRESLSSRPLRPQMNDEPRYFLPGTGNSGTMIFRELDLRTDLEREELKGPVKRRSDFYPGGRIEQSRVDYDALGRRRRERIFDKIGKVRFIRRYRYEGPGFVPADIRVKDGNGVTQTSCSLSLDARGLPLEECQRDFQGLPILNRSYRYDSAGHLTAYAEAVGIDIRALKVIFKYDRKGRLTQRRAKQADVFSPLKETDWDLDWDTGTLIQRREYTENLPVGEGQAGYPEFDARRRQDYRVRFEGAETMLFQTLEESDPNNAFWIRKSRHKLNPGGWLDERETLTKDGDLFSREFWEWDAQGSLIRASYWDRPGGFAASENFEYDYDAQGNWIRRKAASENEAVERKFEYFDR